MLGDAMTHVGSTPAVYAFAVAPGPLERNLSSSESVEYATLDNVGVSNCVLFRSSFMIKFMASLTACLRIEYIGRIDHVFSSPAITGMTQPIVTDLGSGAFVASSTNQPFATPIHQSELLQISQCGIKNVAMLTNTHPRFFQGILRGFHQ
jgi:hypothetical protein